jgi:hypothetical protein
VCDCQRLEFLHAVSGHATFTTPCCDVAHLVGRCRSRARGQEDRRSEAADPDTGESSVEEATLGLLPNPFEKQGVKFAVTYIGEILGNRRVGAAGRAHMRVASQFVTAEINKLIRSNIVSNIVEKKTNDIDRVRF